MDAAIPARFFTEGEMLNKKVYDVVVEDTCNKIWHFTPLEKLDYVRDLYRTLSEALMNSPLKEKYAVQSYFSSEMSRCVENIKSTYYDNNVFDVVLNGLDSVTRLVA